MIIFLIIIIVPLILLPPIRHAAHVRYIYILGFFMIEYMRATHDRLLVQVYVLFTHSNVYFVLLF